MTEREFTVSVETLQSHFSALQQYLVSRGDYDALYAQFAERIRQLDGFEAKQRMSVDRIARSIDTIAEWIDEPLLGLRVSPYSSRLQARMAFFFRDRTLSLLDYFRLLGRYVCISSEVMKLSVSACSEVVTLTIAPSSKGYVSRHQVEGFVASVVDMTASARECLPLTIQFSHAAAPTVEREYADLLGVKPNFEQAQTQITYRNSAGDGFHNARDPSALSMTRLQSMEAARRREISEDSWTARCRFLLELLLVYGQPTKTLLAEILAVTPRTLQRRLDEESITFRDLLTQVRREQAQRLLGQDQQSVETTAFLLGYQDVGQFSRAFRQWFGLPPGQYRETFQRPRQRPRIP